MGYHPGHAVTPGIEVVFSVDCSKGTDIANWTGVVDFVYNIRPKTLVISSLEQKREVLTARKQSALAWGCAGPVYIPPGFQGGPGEIGVLYSHWSLTWDAVVAERAGRSGDTSSKHSWVAGWFQAEILEMVNFYWPLTSAGSPRWKPNFHWLMAQAGSRHQPLGMLNFYWPRRSTASLYGYEVASVLEACASCPRAAYFPQL